MKRSHFSKKRPVRKAARGPSDPSSPLPTSSSSSLQTEHTVVTPSQQHREGAGEKEGLAGPSTALSAEAEMEVPAEAAIGDMAGEDEVKTQAEEKQTELSPAKTSPVSSAVKAEMMKMKKSSIQSEYVHNRSRRESRKRRRTQGTGKDGGGKKIDRGSLQSEQRSKKKRSFREQVMRRVEEDNLHAAPKDMLYMLLDLMRGHHEKVARKHDHRRKLDTDHPCSLTRTVRHVYENALSQMKASIEQAFQPRSIENARNVKNQATIAGLEFLISELEAEEAEWETVERVLLDNADAMPATLLDPHLEEKISSAPDIMQPDGSMNDQISQALFSQTEKVDDVSVMMTHMTHFSNKIGESARVLTRKLGQSLKETQKSRADPQELVSNLLKTA